MSVLDPVTVLGAARARGCSCPVLRVPGAARAPCCARPVLLALSAACAGSKS